MISPRKIVCIVGTRPEAIKMAPVIRSLNRVNWAEVVVLVTGQHRELLDQALSIFGLSRDFDLKVMTDGQSLSQLTGNLFVALEPIFKDLSPDLVIAQGDTTSVMVAGMTSFYMGIPFAHVEAGLRSNNKRDPFPEELNRIIAGLVADIHFAPTKSAGKALLAEGVSDKKIIVTGNTVIDALLSIRGRVTDFAWPRDPANRLILVTAHRRESFGPPFRAMLLALQTIVRNNSDVELLYPVHPNPHVRKMAEAVLAGQERVHLCDPLDYDQFVAAMNRSYLIVTDSGGVQEEAPALGKPVLVMRNETERPEAIRDGVAKLVGTKRQVIASHIQTLLDDPDEYAAMAKGASPYGDGLAAERITDEIACFFEIQDSRRHGEFEGGHQ